MEELEFYDGAYTGAQIDAAVGAALNPDTTPTAASDALITSGAVYNSVGSFKLKNVYVTAAGTRRFRASGTTVFYIFISGAGSTGRGGVYACFRNSSITAATPIHEVSGASVTASNSVFTLSSIGATGVYFALLVFQGTIEEVTT